LGAGIAWMTIVSPFSRASTSVSSRRAPVEAQRQLSVGEVVRVKGLDPQWSLCPLDRILRRDAVFEHAPVDLHAAKWASAARFASDCSCRFLAAAASGAPSSSVVSRTATVCIGSAASGRKVVGYLLDAIEDLLAHAALRCSSAAAAADWRTSPNR
jgi:hypothetical protein